MHVYVDIVPLPFQTSMSVKKQLVDVNKYVTMKPVVSPVIASLATYTIAAPVIVFKVSAMEVCSYLYIVDTMNW